MEKAFLSKLKLERILMHSVFLLVIIGGQPLFQLMYNRQTHFSWGLFFGPISLGFYALFVACIYFTAFVVLRKRPSYGNAANFWLRAIGVVAMFFAYIFLRLFIDQYLMDWLFGLTNYPRAVDFNFFFYDNLVISFVMLLASFYVKFMDDWYISDRMKSTLERQNLRLELDFLKSQVNPHFLFNTLNNIQSFIVQDEKMKSIELIGRLSEFMRFALYETDEEFIGLDKEIDMLDDYIALERVRCEDRVQITFEAKGNFSGYEVPPLLLIPFIENAFKHGADMQLENSWIHIHIVQENDRLHLRVENNFIAPSPAEVAEKPGGIGLQNVRKRLLHYFPQRHVLQITPRADIFEADLQLQLQTRND